MVFLTMWRGYFEIKKNLKLRDLRVHGTIPSSFVQIGSMVEENERVDR